ncbi:MAG: membrane protein [Planctomycetota bacterium]|nr:MAG: membrane protein [Planctomycetota bacterium]
MFDFLHIFATPEAWVSLLTLTALEIVLGIDNIVFIAILTGKLPPAEQARARRLGLAGAMVSRILLLLAIGWIMQLSEPFATVLGVELSGKSLILLGGGLFLIAKATHEIFEKLEAKPVPATAPAKAASAVRWAIVQIMLIDVVFSLDSVITAVGVAKEIVVMAAAVIIAVLVMMAFAGPISAFVHRHPSMKVLALSFLVLIGVLLVAEGFGQHINKGYIYFAMVYALAVELINLRLRKVERRPVALNPGYEEVPGPSGAPA